MVPLKKPEVKGYVCAHMYIHMYIHTYMTYMTYIMFEVELADKTDDIDILLFCVVILNDTRTDLLDVFCSSLPVHAL